MKDETCGSIHAPHTSLFTIDENVLPLGAAMHAALAERYLNEGNFRPSQSSVADTNIS